MAEVEGNAKTRRFPLNLPLYHVTLRHLATNSGHMKFKGIRISRKSPPSHQVTKAKSLQAVSVTRGPVFAVMSYRVAPLCLGLGAEPTEQK